MGQDRGGDIASITARVLGAAIGFGVGGPGGAAAGAQLGGTVSDAAFGGPSGKGGLGKTAKGVKTGSNLISLAGGGKGLSVAAGKDNFLSPDMLAKQNALNGITSGGEGGSKLAIGLLKNLLAGGIGGGSESQPIQKAPEAVMPQLPPNLAGLQQPAKRRTQPMQTGGPAIQRREPSDFDKRVQSILYGGGI